MEIKLDTFCLVANRPQIFHLPTTLRTIQTVSLIRITEEAFGKLLWEHGGVIGSMEEEAFGKLLWEHGGVIGSMEESSAGFD